MPEKSEQLQLCVRWEDAAVRINARVFLRTVQLHTKFSREGAARLLLFGTKNEEFYDFNF